MSRAARINYAEAGQGPSADYLPLICLHGIGGDAESFRPQLDELSGNRRVISWNMPGYGGSAPLAETGFAQLAAALGDFMDALGIRRAHLCGQSIGGMLAQEMAIRHPQRVASLSLIATTAAFGGRDDSFKQRFLQARLAPLDGGASMPDLARRFVPEIVGSAAAPAAIESATRSMAAVPEASYRAIMACLITFNRRDDIAGIRQPACLIAGSEDQNAPAASMRKMAERMPDARFHELNGAGHLLNLECPARCNALIAEFLAETERKERTQT